LSGAIFYSTLTPEGRYQVYQINVDGSGRQLVLEDASEPAISPDRQWLAYYSWRPDALGLRLHNLVTGEDRQLTADNNDSYPSWAPEQSRLAFWNYAADTVHTINFDGSDRRQIAKGEFAAWSPAGDRVAFKGCVDGGRCGIVLANPDGGNPTLLTTYANDGQPAWSPDGRALTFVSDREGNWDIYAINADGSWLRRITDNPTTDGLPEWSLDGTRIAFRSDRDGRWAIWVASGVGGPATKLVDADTGSRWQWEKISWK
jgi:Tol biopolymer transport system component